MTSSEKRIYFKLDAYLRSLGLYVGEKLWFCYTQFRKVFNRAP